MSLWSALDSKLALIFKILLLISSVKALGTFKRPKEGVCYVFSIKF